MLFKIIVLSLAIIQFVTALDKSDPENSDAYRKDLKFFEAALRNVNGNVNSTDRFAKFRALAAVLKEDDPAYSQKILKLTFALRNYMIDAERRNDQKLLGSLENMKRYIPSYIQNLTCTRMKFYSTFLQGYLYSHIRLMYNGENRYTFADGNWNELTSTWKFVNSGDYVIILNDFLGECLYPERGGIALTWVPTRGWCGDNAWYALEIIPSKESIRFRNTLRNDYLQVSYERVEGKQVMKFGPGSETSYWQIHCVLN